MSDYHETINGYRFFSIDHPEEEPFSCCETCGAVVLYAQIGTHAQWHLALLSLLDPPPNPSLSRKNPPPDPFRAYRGRLRP
jgi:hypothetical protein